MKKILLCATVFWIGCGGEDELEDGTAVDETNVASDALTVSQDPACTLENIAPGECSTRAQLSQLARLTCESRDQLLRQVSFEQCDGGGQSEVNFKCCPAPVNVCEQRTVTTTQACALKGDLRLLAKKSCDGGAVSAFSYANACTLQVGTATGSAGFTTAAFTCCQ